MSRPEPVAQFGAAVGQATAEVAPPPFEAGAAGQQGRALGLGAFDERKHLAAAVLVASGQLPPPPLVLQNLAIPGAARVSLVGQVVDENDPDARLANIGTLAKRQYRSDPSFDLDVSTRAEPSPGGWRVRVTLPRARVFPSERATIKFNVRGIPALLLFKGGQVVDQVVGLVPKDDIKKVIDKHLS